LIVTRGEEGAFYPHEGRLYRVPAPAVQAVDTIGAGDNFHGAFALAISLGFDLHRAVRFAVATASLSCRDYGGRQGLPDLREALATTGQIKEEIVCRPR
jgi:sulfofructose kinase